jgi:hypothetical protein
MSDNEPGANRRVTEQMLSIDNVAFKAPLYIPIAVTDPDFMERLRLASFKLDVYCTECGRDSIFHVFRPDYVRPISFPAGSISQGSIRSLPKQLESGSFSVDANCVRCRTAYESRFRYDGKVLTKIGQFPSIADLEGADLRRFRGLLRGGYFEELNRAIGLASHGIGIGAFVYLRRIFEKLIDDHYGDHVRSHGAIDDYASMSIDQRVAALKKNLPAALVTNKVAYKILSKGIHELSEEECKLYFPLVRAVIVAILEEDFQRRERDRAAKVLSNELGKIAEALNRGDA